MSFENKFNNNGSQHRRPPFEDKLNINYDHHHRSPNGQPNTSIEILTPSIKAISDSFKEMHTQFESLKRVNDSLVNFNKAFGSFLFGMAANDTTLQWKQVIYIYIYIYIHKIFYLNNQTYSVFFPCSMLLRKP
jgi:hypothetical protein